MANRIAQATVGIDVDKSDLLKQINEALKSGQALANGAQINIDTNVDTSELKKQLQEAEKEVKRIQNKINSVDLSSLKSGVEKAYKTMDKNPDSDKFLRDFVKSFKEYIALGGKVKDLNEDIVEAYKLSDFDKEFVPIKKIKLLSDELQVAKDKVESLNSAIKSTGTGGFDSTSTQIKELQEQLDDLGKKYKELQEKMSKVKGSDVDLASNEQFTKLASNLAEVQKEIVDIKEEMKQFASNDNWADGAIKELIESYKRVNDEVQTVISSIQELRKLQSTPIVTKVEEKPTFESSKRESSSNDNTSQPNDINYLLDKDILEETFDDTIQAVQKFNSRLSKEKASLEKILLGMKEDFEELRNSDIDESFKEALTSDDYDSKDELYADFADQYYQRAQEWFYDRSSAIQDDKADGLYEDARDYDQYLASMADSYEKCLQMIDMIEDADLKAEKLSEYSKLYAEDINGDDKDRTKSLSLGRDALQTIVEDYEREAGKLNEQVNTIIADIDRLSKIEVQASWFETPDSVKSGISSDSIKEEKTELQGLIDEFTRLASLHEHMRTNMSGFSKSPTYTQESIQEVQTVYTELKQAMIAMNQLQINPEVNKDKILELSAYITELDKKFKVLATYNDSKQGDTLNYLGIAKEDHGLYFDTNKYVLDWQVLSELMWDVSKKIREIDSTFEASSITINPEPFKEIIGLLNTIENKAEDITPLPSGDKTEVLSNQTPLSNADTTVVEKVEQNLEEVENQAKQTEQAVREATTLPPAQDNNTPSLIDNLKAEKETLEQVVNAEVQEFDKLSSKVKEVETAIEEKTNAITAEKIAMEIASKSEVESLQNIINKVDELKNGLKELPEVKVPTIKVEEEKTEQGQIASGATHIQNNPKEAIKRGKSKGEKVDTSLTPEQLKARTDSLRKTSEELEANLAEQGSIIKSVTDFYDSQDNLVKTVLKEEKELGDGTKKATTWTTNYNLEKGTSFSSHIDTTSFIDESKAVEAVRKAQFEEAKKYLSDYKTYSINAIHSTVEANKQMYEEEAASAKASANAIINTLKIEGVLLEQEENQYDALSDSIERTIKLKTDERQNVQNQRDFNADWDAAIKENKEFDKRKAQEKAQLEKYEQERTAEEKRLSDIRIQQAEYEANEKRKHEQEYISWWETTYRDVDKHLSDTYSKLESNLTKQNPLKLKDNSNKLSSNEQLELNRLMQEETNLRGIIADYSSIGIKNQQAEIELQKKQNALAEDYSNTLRTQATNAREAAQKELSKAIDDYGYGDTTEAKKYLSQLSSNSIYPDFNNLDSQIKSINDTVDDIVSKLKTSHISNKSGMASDIKEENEKVSKLLSENKKHYEDIWRIRKQIEVIDDTPENAEYLRTLKKQQAFYGKQYEASKKEIENLNIKSVLQKQEETRLKIKEEQLRVINTLIEKGNASEATRNQKVLDRFQNSANQSLANFNIDFKDNPNLSNIEERLNALKASVNSITDQEGLKRFNNELNQLGDSLRGVSDLSASKISNKIQKWLDDNTNASHELRAELERLQQELSETFVTKARGNEILKFLHDADVATRKAGKSGDSFFEGWKKRMKNLALYLTSFASFYDVINKVREGVNVVRELDTALTEMRKVSDETVESLRAFQKVSFDIADTVGSTAIQIQNSTSDFLRLGESMEQAVESAQVANILLNVSEFESIDEATESLIAMSSAYKEIEKIDIVDKLNLIGNSFQISTDGIATALQSSASALTTAGNSIDEAIALVTAGNAVVQDPSSVGAAMRVISLRLTGTKEAKEQLLELNDGTEGVITTVSKLREVIMSATKVASNGFKGVDILDENGNYKSTYEILQSIADVYKEIVETDKKTGSNNVNLLLETLAGEILPEICGNTFYRTHLIARIA